MDSFWVKLDTSESKKFVLDSPSIWENSIKQFNMDCKLVQPFSGIITVTLQENGCMVDGSISGKIVMPCNRCTTDVLITIQHTFRDVEPLPTLNIDGKEVINKDINENIIRQSNGIIEVNLAEILWEEFVLSLPSKPLCNIDCNGLCYSCGKDLNKETCNCSKDEGDPRLAAFKNIVIK
ncbi:DUF177 domain-containing protein [Lawsonia intracellularis]|uniref:Predicted metal-binding, possibly nucleic acid-binding protein n=1 Tax=Lawsonia intracellularis (strain PHE/MN1-00) TaxID=363253 RepID=Q1MS06_LAWIP|nr:DUF177 domain-containing protein [Lawsonia intracellularis]AGC49567.1 hypothetical protein LAW_00166 [Lawsonia intracellularis N343]KAA0205089.1 DUF177 domain-containing protein [Lawsonia intracellularis]MBZ3892385.1 DUF177 domain-containing protein [Lawsonia intracellularis]OMQ06228.1 metal-binding protein [Lawsonia intracellularis]RBN32363.1 DUF177 domain-containing protein [Lawsonia intracellularis]